MKEVTNERFKVHDTIVSWACMIWAVVSFILMCYFTGENQVTFSIMTCGQLFLVLGIISLCRKQMTGGIFTITGLACIILPAINEWAPLFVNGYTTNYFLPICLSLGIGIVGLTLLIIPGVLEDSSERRCKKTVQAECIDLKEIEVSNGVNAYAPVYQYTYNDKVYDKCTEKYRTNQVPTIGDKIEFRINEKAPEEVYMPTAKSSLMIIYIVGVSFLLTGVGMLMTLLG